MVDTSGLTDVAGVADTAQGLFQSYRARRNARLRSEAIDVQITKDHQQREQVSKVLLMGTCESSKADLLHEMKVLHSGEAEPTAHTEACFVTGLLLIRVFTLNARESMIMKPMPCFDDATSIIFYALLSDYDQVLDEAGGLTKLGKSLDLFQSIMNSRWARHMSVILILGDMDGFKRKLELVPLEHFFPDYKGGAAIEKAAKYILWKFIKTNTHSLPIYPHLLTQVDTSVVRLVFAAVKDTILQEGIS